LFNVKQALFIGGDYIATGGNKIIDKVDIVGSGDKHHNPNQYFCI
jgi:hypothetical protein